MIDYTKEPNYDIRKIPCGKWKSSMISVQSHGRWLQFTDPDSNNIYNNTLPINFNKKYVPPRKSNLSKKKQQMKKQKSEFEECITEFGFVKNDLIQAKEEFFKAPNFVVPPIEYSPERVSRYSNDANITSSRLSSRTKHNSPRDNTSEASHVVSTHTVAFNDIEIPQTERVDINHNENRNSFRNADKKLFHASNSSRTRNSSSNSNNSSQRPKTAIRPQKTILREEVKENDMVVFGSRPKSSIRS